MSEPPQQASGLASAGCAGAGQVPLPVGPLSVVFGAGDVGVGDDQSALGFRARAGQFVVREQAGVGDAEVPLCAEGGDGVGGSSRLPVLGRDAHEQEVGWSGS